MLCLNYLMALNLVVLLNMETKAMAVATMISRAIYCYCLAYIEGQKEVFLIRLHKFSPTKRRYHGMQQEQHRQKA